MKRISAFSFLAVLSAFACSIQTGNDPFGAGGSTGDRDGDTGGMGAGNGGSDTGGASGDGGSDTGDGGIGGGGGSDAGGVSGDGGSDTGGVSGDGGSDAGGASGDGGSDTGGASGDGGSDAGGASGDGDGDTGGASGDGDGDTGDGGTGGGGGNVVMALDEAVAGDLLITEIMANPLAIDDTLAEWFEIQNTTVRPLDLNGLTLSDNAGSATIQTSIIVPAQGYVVFARSSGALGSGQSPTFVYGDKLQLSNASDFLRLSTGSITFDEVSFDETFHGSAGYSIRLEPGRDALENDVAAAWCTSGTQFDTGDYGSPGQENGPCLKFIGAVIEGELVITEIMANPDGVEDADAEWFEIYNAGASVIDLNGLEVRDDDIDSFVVDRTLLIAPDGYLIFGVAGAADSTGGPAPSFVYSHSAFQVANSIDEIVLVGPGLIVDQVAYINPPVGASFSLSHALLNATDNDLMSSWCAATGVTSGDKNSAAEPNPVCP